MAVRTLLQVTTIRARLVYLGDEPSTFTLKDEELEVAIQEAVDYLVAGSVPPAAAEAAARDL